MIEKFKDALYLAIELELMASQIYMYFHEKFTEEKDFWWELVIEEKNHAALLRSVIPIYEINKEAILKFLPSRELLEETLLKLKEMYTDIQKRDLTLKEAFELAYFLENSAGEAHFQKFLEGEAAPSNDVEMVIQQLGRDDILHAERVKNRAKQYGWELE
jgi:rubrerythrin